MSKNAFDVVVKNLESYYIKYFSHVTGTYSGHVHETRIRQEQKNGNLFSPIDFKAYVETLREITEGNTSELTDVIYKLKGDLEERQGKSQKLMKERKLISNKMGVVSFLQTTDQDLIKQANNIKAR